MPRSGPAARRSLISISSGLLGPQLTIGHGVWMTEADIELCAHRHAHLPQLQLQFPAEERRRAGEPLSGPAASPVAIGIDEAGINDDRDMLQEMRLVLRAHREPGIDAPHPSPAQVLRMATEHGAATTPFAGRDRPAVAGHGGRCSCCSTGRT